MDQRPLHCRIFLDDTARVIYSLIRQLVSVNLRLRMQFLHDRADHPIPRTHNRAQTPREDEGPHEERNQQHAKYLSAKVFGDQVHRPERLFVSISVWRGQRVGRRTATKDTGR